MLIATPQSANEAAEVTNGAVEITNVDRTWIWQYVFSADRGVVWRDRFQLATISIQKMPVCFLSLNFL
jgi:hypothetical protein